MITTDPLQDQVKQIHQLISYLTHEVKNPMTTIKGYSEIIARGIVGEVNDKQSQFLKVIQASVDKMDTIISNIDTFSKLQTGNLNFSIEAVDLKDGFIQVRNSLFNAITEKRLEIRSNIDDDLPCLSVDPKILNQILTHLLGNAVEYSPEDDHITFQAELSSQDEKMAYITLQDHRQVLSQIEQKAFFDLNFETAEPSQITEQLSLMIVKELITLHGGEIWFQSQNNHGGCFHFTLPIDEA
jgi:signal transduction histidine kinase